MQINRFCSYSNDWKKELDILIVNPDIKSSVKKLKKLEYKNIKTKFIFKKKYEKFNKSCTNLSVKEYKKRKSKFIRRFMSKNGS